MIVRWYPYLLVFLVVYFAICQALALFGWHDARTSLIFFFELMAIKTLILIAIVEIANRIARQTFSVELPPSNGPQQGIDWANAPVWAQWFAVDANGNGWFYKARPRIVMDCWGNAETGSPYEPVYGIQFVVDDWKRSLVGRP